MEYVSLLLLLLLFRYYINIHVFLFYFISFFFNNFIKIRNIYDLYISFIIELMKNLDIYKNGLFYFTKNF
jgi:hypothetical protein